MSINFEEILKELEYRVQHGIIDLTKEEQVTELANILRENNISDANEMAQKARVYFSYLIEATPKIPAEKIMSQTVTNPDTGNKIQVSSALQYKNSDSPGQKAAYQQAKSMFKQAGYDDNEIDKISSSSEPETPSTPAANIFGKGKGAPVYGAEKAKNPQEIKKEIDRISIEAANSRNGFYNKGYHKAEGEDDAGAAPGNAGSMLNENGSCDVAEWALENESDSLLDAVSHLYKNLKGGDLLESADKRGIAGQEDKVPSVTAGQLREFRNSGKGKFNDLSDGQLSRLMMAANGGLIKARKIREGIKANKWKEEDCVVNGFFGDTSGKAQQMDMVRQSNKIFAPDGTEIPKDIALKLVAAGGGGANPSDTSQFIYNQKTGDLMIKFTSDKDSFDAIVAQSSFQKEGSIKKQEIEKLIKEKGIKEPQAELLRKLSADGGIIDKYTTKLNDTESELKTVGAEPAKKMLSMPIKEVMREFKTLSGGSTPDAYYQSVIKKYMGKPFNSKTPEEAVTSFLKFAALSPEQQDAFATKTGSKNAKFTSKEAEIVGRLKSRFGLDPLVAKKIDDIRKRSIEIERKLLNEMNKIPVKIGSDSVGLGDYLDAKNFIDKFHMAGAMGDKHGVFAYNGLFEVVCGVGVINNDIISNCMNTNNMDDFIKKFGSTKEEFQLSKENAITGSVRIAYFLNDKGQKIRIGEKRQRSKTGATGRFNTVYKWDKDTIECFKRKNGVA